MNPRDTMNAATRELDKLIDWLAEGTAGDDSELEAEVLEEVGYRADVIRLAFTDSTAFREAIEHRRAVAA